MKLKTLATLFILSLILSIEAFCIHNQFWATQKKGANIFSADLNEETISAAKKYNIQFLRLAVDKIEPNKRDFFNRQLR